MSECLQQREGQGAYSNLVREVRENDEERFYNFHRMTPEMFDILLEKVDPLIRKQDFIRESLSPGVRLSLTLRYLSSGDSMTSLHYLCRVSKSSVTRIIPETCNALWQVLTPEVLRKPTTRDWLKVAEEFENKWDFPNCIGAIDGKHFVIQCPDNSGSQFYNYKGSFSIVLMVLCDAQYRFTYVSIGAAGRESDSGVFENTSLGKSIIEETLPLPGPRLLPGSTIEAPYVIVGVNAFPLRENLMKPYPGTELHPSQIVFNYRTSRSRRLSENTFGVTANRFRILRRPILASVPTAESMVRATVVLHYFFRTADLKVAPRRRQYIHPGLVDLTGMEILSLASGDWK